MHNGERGEWSERSELWSVPNYTQGTTALRFIHPQKPNPFTPASDEWS